jgi:hypothetical protein
MKKALVIGCLVGMVFGVAAFAGPLSGSWSNSFCFEYGADEEIKMLAVGGFSSVLELDYTVCGWTFSSTAIFLKHSFYNLWFEATGSVGAFGFYGVLDFFPQSVSFKYLAGFVDVSIAGVSLYAGGGIKNFNYNISTTPAIGVGFVVGGYGVAGDCSIWVESQFNMCAKIGTIYWYGYDYMLDTLLYLSGTSCSWVKDVCLVQSTCYAIWSGLDIYVNYSFACLDVLTMVNFDCVDGFDHITFALEDICLGLPWLELDDLKIRFDVDGKHVCGQFELVL